MSSYDPRLDPLGALSLDLLRISKSLMRGSNQAAKAFFKEACKRADEAMIENHDPILHKLLHEFKIKLTKQNDRKTRIESANSYSSLFEKYWRSKHNF